MTVYRPTIDDLLDNRSATGTADQIRLPLESRLDPHVTPSSLNRTIIRRPPVLLDDRALTGLPGRRWFEARLKRDTDVAQRRSETPVVMLLDLDHFTHLNHALGHGAGDRVLRTVARRLRDRLGPQVALARTGSDEFALVPHSGAITSGSVDFARRLSMVLAQPFVTEHGELRISASIGIGLCHNGVADSCSLMRCAEHALEAARRQGRGAIRQCAGPGRVACFEQPTH